MSSDSPVAVLFDTSGNEKGVTGNPVKVDPTGTTTQPVSGSVTVSQATGSNLHAVLDTGSTTAVTQATASSLNATVVQGTGSNLHTVVDSGAVTVSQATGTNLHAVLDTGSTTAVTQATGSNLHAVLDTGSTTAVTQATASNLNATVVQSTASNLNATVAQATGSNLHTVVDSGSITANIGTSGSLALDATLTGGTQKAIARGGAKGATTAADVTSTAEGADHQALDVQLYNGGTAINPTQIRALASGTDTVTVAQATGTNLHAVLDTGSTTAVTQATGTNLHTVVDSGAVTVSQATGTNLHTVLDTGSTTAVTQATAANLNATVVQATGTNLHTVVDSGAVTVSQATAANLNATVSQATAANLNATVAQATAGNLNATVVGTKTNNNAAPGTNNLGVLPALANAAAPTWTEGNQATLSADLAGNLRVRNIRSGTSSVTSVAAAVADTSLLAANAARVGATVANDSTAIMYLKLGTGASATSFTVRLTANAYYEVPFGYTGAINGYWSSATGNARVTELT